MRIHSVNVGGETTEALAALNCWAIGTINIQRLSCLIDCADTKSRLRTGSMRGIIAGRKFGSSADRLADELNCLAEQCAVILSATDCSILLAAAFFHLRLENIHPLTDGNGRLGRLLLAEQIRRAYSIPIVVVLNLIQAFERDYRSVFAAPRPEQQYEQMVNFVSRLTAVRVTSIPPLRYALSPAFPERNTSPTLSLNRTAIQSVQERSAAHTPNANSRPCLTRR